MTESQGFENLTSSYFEGNLADSPVVPEEPIAMEIPIDTNAPILRENDETSDDNAGTSSSKQNKKEETVIHSFAGMNLKRNVRYGLLENCISKPTTIQTIGIPASINGDNIMVHASPGSGKTTMFGISVLNRIDTSVKDCQAIVLVPTQALAEKFESIISKLAVHIDGFKGYVCPTGVRGDKNTTTTTTTTTTMKSNLKSIGYDKSLSSSTHCSSDGDFFVCPNGEAFEKLLRFDLKTLKEGFHVAIGTPECISYIIVEKLLNTDCVKLLVVDDADEMLSGDCKAQRHEILKNLPQKVQVFVSSTTLPRDELEISETFLHDPVGIVLPTNELHSSIKNGMKHYYCLVENEAQKYNVFWNLLKSFPRPNIYIFCNSRTSAECIHNQTKQGNDTVRNYITDEEEEEDYEEEVTPRRDENGAGDVNGAGFVIHYPCTSLITTDLFIRGINVDKISILINYDLPSIPVNYLRRIYSCGSFDQDGFVLNMVTVKDEHVLKEIEKFHDIKITKYVDKNVVNKK